MFGEVCPGCHIRFIKIFRHQKEKKKKTNQPRDLISDSQAESTSGTVLSGHNRLTLPSCLQNQQEFGTFLSPPPSMCPLQFRLSLFSCSCSHLQPLQTEAQTLLLPHFWLDTEPHPETGKEETQTSCLNSPGKVSIKIQVFFQAQQLSLRAITSF